VSSAVSPPNYGPERNAYVMKVVNGTGLVRAHHHAAPDLGNASFQPGEPCAKSRLSY